VIDAIAQGSGAGITLRDHRLLARGERYSAIAIMSMEGLLDVHLADGTVNGLKFEEFVKSSLIPILNPFNWNNKHSLVVMDNASIHPSIMSRMCIS